MKNCPECESFIPASAVVCSECGFEDVKKRKNKK
ncbi:zinc ribbon domain-containing protein [Maribacter dokdonensis]